MERLTLTPCPALASWRSCFSLSLFRRVTSPASSSTWLPVLSYVYSPLLSLGPSHLLWLTMGCYLVRSRKFHTGRTSYIEPYLLTLTIGRIAGGRPDARSQDRPPPWRCSQGTILGTDHWRYFWRCVQCFCVSHLHSVSLSTPVSDGLGGPWPGCFG